MKEPSIVDRLLKNMGNMHELGRQRAFELATHSMHNLKKTEVITVKKCPTVKNTWLR